MIGSAYREVVKVFRSGMIRRQRERAALSAAMPHEQQMAEKAGRRR